jgi:transcriptional regulator with XRE-family HTH domain
MIPTDHDRSHTMALSFEGKKVRDVLKKLMKQQGFEYSELAKALRVSVPTVKRIMTKDDLPLERLIHIAAWLGTSVGEIFELAASDRPGTNSFSDKQEKFLAASPRALLYFHALFTGLQPNDIEARFKFGKKEAHTALAALEEAKLIEVWPQGRVRVMIHGPIRLSPGGAFEKAYREKVGRSVFNELQRRAFGDKKLLKTSNPVLFRVFEMTTRPETLARLNTEMLDLIEKYRALSVQQLKLERREDLISVTGIVGACEFYPWAEILH